MVTSRERVSNALNHKESDRVPLDIGASAVTGMQVDTVYKLRQALGLDAPGTPVKVVEPYQMLGEIKPDLMDALGIDVVGLENLPPCSDSRTKDGNPGPPLAARQCLFPKGSTPTRTKMATSSSIPRETSPCPPAAACPKADTILTRRIANFRWMTQLECRR